MCGIALILKPWDLRCRAEVLDRMCDDVAHRGPDDRGTAFFSRAGRRREAACGSDSDWEVGLAHRRLSILDLSAAGHQPMGYREQFWITYNGEVYNFLELRAELEQRGHVFHSRCDTEVVLAAYAEWGTDCFARFGGMWAMAIVDFRSRELVLCRDRLGIKPIYFREQGGLLAAASETKQFQHLPGFAARLDQTAATEFLLTGYEDSSRSFLDGVHPVPAGHFVRLSLNSLRVETPVAYWHPERVTVAVRDSREAGERFAAKLRDSVRLHLRSDVPVGCALSGGLDSSAIAVLVNRELQASGKALNTFTSTFPGSQIDEREYADSVVRSIRGQPHYVTPSPEGFLDDLDRFVWIHDEPVGGLSIYASYCIARLTRQAGVPVVLNGQGGDEVLSGYWQSYFMHLRHLAQHLRLGLLTAQFLGAGCPQGNAELLRQVPWMLQRYRRRRQPNSLVRLRSLPAGRHRGILDQVLAQDERSYRVHEIRQLHLPRLLKWDDRNSMAFSVEGRYPFLDHELVELCLSFDSKTLYQAGWTKMPLRRGLHGVLPDEIIRRKTKLGFETPQDEWLRGPLRPCFQRWLSQDRPLWQIASRPDVGRLATRVWNAKTAQQELGQMLFRLFMLDRWLTTFDVAVEPEAAWELPSIPSAITPPCHEHSVV